MNGIKLIKGDLIWKHSEDITENIYILRCILC